MHLLQTEDLIDELAAALFRYKQSDKENSRRPCGAITVFVIVLSSASFLALPDSVCLSFVIFAIRAKQLGNKNTIGAEVYSSGTAVLC